MNENRLKKLEEKVLRKRKENTVKTEKRKAELAQIEDDNLKYFQGVEAGRISALKDMGWISLCAFVLSFVLILPGITFTSLLPVGLSIAGVSVGAMTTSSVCTSICSKRLKELNEEQIRRETIEATEKYKKEVEVTKNKEKNKVENKTKTTKIKKDNSKKLENSNLEKDENINNVI